MVLRNITSLEPEILYVPEWSTQNHHRNTQRFGAMATLKFTGTRVRVFGALFYSGHRKATFAIDDMLMGTYENTNYDGMHEEDVLLFDHEDLHSGPHTIVVTNFGQHLSLVAFEIDDDHPAGNSAPNGQPSSALQPSGMPLGPLPSAPTATPPTTSYSTYIDGGLPTSRRSSTPSSAGVIYASNTVELTLASSLLSTPSMSPSDTSSPTGARSIPTATVIGGVVGGVVACMLCAICLWWFIRRGNRYTSQQKPVIIRIMSELPPRVSVSIDERQTIATLSDGQYAEKYGSSFTTSDIPELPPYGYTCPEPQLSEGVGSVSWRDK